jgi:hypothetical protein
MIRGQLSLQKVHTHYAVLQSQIYGKQSAVRDGYLFVQGGLSTLETTTN